MEPVRRAVIDVGTNSIKLLVADVAGREVHPVLEESKQTRLGRGFYDTHRLQLDAIVLTAKAVGKFADVAREQGASSVRIIATSAARDAKNPQDLTSALEQVSGLKVQIISGEQEADWVFQGATTDPALAREPLLLLDVGGGSTEFILGRGEHKHFRQSFPIGTVRLMERIPPSDPPERRELAACREWLREFLRSEVQPNLEPVMRLELKGKQADGNIALVGTGGTATILARMEGKFDAYDRERIEATRLSLNRLKWHARRLWSLPLEARKQIVGLPQNRADVILTGVAIYEAVLENFEFSQLRITTRGLRFAVIMEKA